MFTPRLMIAIFAVSVAVAGHAQQTDSSGNSHAVPAAAAEGETSSPAQLSIDAALRQIKGDPRKAQAFGDLASAYLRRARETAQQKYLVDAGKAVSHGLQLDPTNFGLQKTQVALLIANSQFAVAKEKATLLNRRTPDDVIIYGYLADADIALGNYMEAERSAQWMLNMRANNVPGLLLAATLRETFGDADGAVELLNLAYSETSPTEVEDLAWIANRIASIDIASGKADAAGLLLDGAERLFPGYPYTLENLARLRLAQNRPAEAVALLLRAAQSDSNPHVVYSLAQAQRNAGQLAEARASEAAFTRLTEALPTHTAQIDHDLVLLDSAAPETRPQALELAQRAIALRHDVATQDAFAWALYSNGRFAEAKKAIQAALAVGIQSAEIFDHAGHIAEMLKDQAEAAKNFELSLRVDPASPYAGDARTSLRSVPGAQVAALSTAETRSVPEVTLTPAVPKPQTAARFESVGAPVVTTSPARPVSFSPVPAASLVPLPTATERIIHSAQTFVNRNPKDAKAYASLGAAYVQRARESGDVSDYQLAEQSLNLSLNLVSTDFSADAALESLSEVCMGEHRFRDALTYSQRALSLGSGDLSPFAIVGDAYADMGEYEKASVSYEKLASPLLPVSSRTSFARDSRMSYLTFVAGDTQKAVEQMRKAVAEGIEAQLPQENLAWLYYELGEYLSQAGDAGAADTAYLSALVTHPGDYRALAGLARLRANHGRYAEAIELYRKAIAIVPMPIFVAELGDVYAKTGNQAEAKRQYQLVEYIGLLGKVNQVLHNRDLALFYADHDIKLPEALALAQKEFEVRHDIYTWDALAWALFKNGKRTEAKEASKQSLRFGTRDALLLYHAGVIAGSLGEQDRSKRQLMEALQINPNFHLIYAQSAREKLGLPNAHTPATASLQSYDR